MGFVRSSNNSGGLEGGITNGMPVVVRGTMKPISTLLRGLPSVDLNTKEAEHSQYERSDVSAISAASVVMENVVAFEIARACTSSGDSMTEVQGQYRHSCPVPGGCPSIRRRDPRTLPTETEPVERERDADDVLASATVLRRTSQRIRRR